jgi:flagella basal body P-ring formation protein FlgA
MRFLSLCLFSCLAFGATARAVEPTPAPLSRTQLLADLAAQLTVHFSLEGDLQVDLVRPWTPPAQTAKLWTLDVYEYPNAAASSMLVRCRVLADGVAVENAALVLRASLWRDAWVARHPLARDSVFDPAQLDVRRVDLFRDRDALATSIGDRHYVLARSVGAGYLLTWHDIMRRPLVRKGNLIEVAAIDGDLLITMKALAMESGAQGDTVTVRNPETRKDFSALVVDENRVQIRF